MKTRFAVSADLVRTVQQHDSCDVTSALTKNMFYSFLLVDSMRIGKTTALVISLGGHQIQ